jgi:hypothetical protein
VGDSAGHRNLAVFPGSGTGLLTNQGQFCNCS